MRIILRISKNCYFKIWQIKLAIRANKILSVLKKEILSFNKKGILSWINKNLKNIKLKLQIYNQNFRKK